MTARNDLFSLDPFPRLMNELMMIVAAANRAVGKEGDVSGSGGLLGGS